MVVARVCPRTLMDAESYPRLTGKCSVGGQLYVAAPVNIVYALELVQLHPLPCTYVGRTSRCIATARLSRQHGIPAHSRWSQPRPYHFTHAPWVLQELMGVSPLQSPSFR